MFPTGANALSIWVVGWIFVGLRLVDGPFLMRTDIGTLFLVNLVGAEAVWRRLLLMGFGASFSSPGTACPTTGIPGPRRPAVGRR